MTITPRSRRLALATGLSYHLLEWGDPDAPTIVLVHGFLDLAWGWDAVAQHLAITHRVIAPDLRGHGDSDWIGPGGYYHFLDYLADVDELLARTTQGPIYLVGHSMGGSVASYVAGTRPERVHHLALLEGLGPPEAFDPLPARAARWIAAWKAARAAPPRALPSLVDAADRLRKHDPRLDPARAHALAAHGTRAVAGGVAWKHDPLHATMGPYPFRRELADQFWKAITAPTLILDAADSTFRLPDAETASRVACFRDARRAVLADAGHMMQRHQPAALARLLLDFVAAPT